MAPEAHAGGPLAIVREGDFIELDCAAGRPHLDVPQAEIEARLAVGNRSRPPTPPTPAAIVISTSNVCCRLMKAATSTSARLPGFGSPSSFTLNMEPLARSHLAERGSSSRSCRPRNGLHPLPFGSIRPTGPDVWLSPSRGRRYQPD